MTSFYNKTTLGGGLRVVSERVDSSSSVAVGIWVACGSRDEKPEENGLAHLIEHMVFKGTADRDKLAIAKAIDHLGGQTNAFTTKEHTCFHTRVRPEHLAEAIDLLSDIFNNSLFASDELELEKGVIQQEIAMVEDDPEELAHDLASLSVWPDHPLGRPVAGTPESVDGLGRDSIVSFIDRTYTGPRIVISAAGQVEHQQLLDLIAERIKPRSGVEARFGGGPVSRYGLIVKRRKLEQAHLVITCDFPRVNDDRRRAAAVLNLVLGGNMSSRLFQEIREQRGLVYNVYSYYTAYQDAGALEIYAAAAPDRIEETRDLIMKELLALRSAPPTKEELNEAVNSSKTSLILGGESMDSRMSRLGKNELIFGRAIDLAETFYNLEQVTREGLSALAEEFFSEGRTSVYVLGPVKKTAGGLAAV
ncbi:peptidase M16 [Deltaproteobacteria bacterium Smac51]|nr:peptidase M16 [Deltaproteobacteria bacterium Smac51]